MKKAVLCGITMLALAGWAGAQGPGPGQPQGPGQRRGGPGPAGDRLEQVQERLGLSAQQMEQLRQLRVEHQKAEIRRKADLAIARLEMNDLFRAATVDEKAVAAKLKVVGDLEFAALKARVDQRLALRRIVSAEQAEKIEQAIGRRRGAGNRQGQGPGRPGRAPRGQKGPGGGWDPVPEGEQ